jgi:hypothetical protein
MVSTITSRGTPEVRVELPEQRHRPFGQARIFDHQPFVAQQCEPHRARRRFRSFADQPLALVLVDDHVAARSFSA